MNLDNASDRFLFDFLKVRYIAHSVTLVKKLFRSYYSITFLQKLSDNFIYGLNGVPSIIFGIFGLIFFVNILETGISWFIGSIILAIMILPTIVERTLSAVSLWKEVAHRLDDRAESLSLGQQQRLCIARTLAVNPEVILLDEPTSALDPVATRAIETLLLELKTQYTLIFVTHNIMQAKRIADKLVFLCDGQVVEQGDKDQLFNNPLDDRTRDYLHDEFCAC